MQPAPQDDSGARERDFPKSGPRASLFLVYYGTDGCRGWQRIDRPVRTIMTIDRFALVEPNVGEHQIRTLRVSDLRRAMRFKAQIKHDSRWDEIKLLEVGVCRAFMQTVVEQIRSD
jgi:DNA (cytosine-5)-methyltransferase 1